MSQAPIHLDTSFLIRALERGSTEDKKLRGLLREERGLFISAIAWAEFLCGPLDDRHFETARRITTEVIAFTVEDAGFAAELFNRSGRRRNSFVDCMVAATALRCDAELATANPADFQRLGVVLAE